MKTLPSKNPSAPMNNKMHSEGSISVKAKPRQTAPSMARMAHENGLIWLAVRRNGGMNASGIVPPPIMTNTRTMALPALRADPSFLNKPDSAMVNPLNAKLHVTIASASKGQFATDT